MGANRDERIGFLTSVGLAALLVVSALVAGDAGVGCSITMVLAGLVVVLAVSMCVALWGDEG